MTLAINAAGSSFSFGGVSYLADQYFSGGQTFQVTSAIANTTSDTLYQSERYGANFSYALPVSNGQYLVTLQFAEIYYGSAGRRVFDVLAEGGVVLDDLDVVAAAGGSFTAKDFVVPVTVVDGALDLQFVSSIDNATINAIRVE